MVASLFRIRLGATIAGLFGLGWLLYKWESRDEDLYIPMNAERIYEINRLERFQKQEGCEGDFI